METDRKEHEARRGRGRTSGRRVPGEAKARAALRVLSGEEAREVAREMGVGVERVERWKQRFVEGGTAALGQRRRRWLGEKGRTAVWQWTGVAAVLLVTVWILARFLQGGEAP